MMTSCAPRRQVAINLCLAVLPLIAQEGTASLTGLVRDVNGTPIPRVGVELRAVNPPGQLFTAISGESGRYSFSDLPAGEYTLKIQSAGFGSETVPDIRIADGDHISIPSLELSLAMCGMDGPIRPQSLMLLHSPRAQVGTFKGSVRLNRGLDKPHGPPINGADVTLICHGAETCGKTKTNSNGEFVFENLFPATYALRVQHPGFYPEELSNYDIQAGFESVYWPISLERCVGGCNPSRRPRKPIAICE